ncbi:hypothetical protein HN873_040198, partial [Arachis hypogaea]
HTYWRYSIPHHSASVSGCQRFFSHQPNYRRRPLPHHQHSSLSRSSSSSPFSRLRCCTLVRVAPPPST